MKEFRGFRFDSRLARGGMASVYRGTQLSLDRPVAIKELYPHLAEDGQYISRFEREAKVLATFSSENIVGIIDYGQQDGAYYIVMEYVDGYPLKSLISKAGNLSTNTALTVAEMMAKGLSYAHRKGVIHRDIKPENILLSTDGVVKIADFGLTRSIGGTHLTVTGTVMGTPAYMSPEQAKGDKVDGRTDIYAWGVTLYEMLSGQKAYKGDTYTAVLSKLLTEPPPPLTDFCPSLPEELRNLVDRCITKEVGERPESFDAILTEINSIRRKYDKLNYPNDLKGFVCGASSLRNDSDEIHEITEISTASRKKGKKLRALTLVGTVFTVAMVSILAFLIIKKQSGVTGDQKGYLSILSIPEGAEIILNDEKLAWTTPAIVEVDTGKGSISLYVEDSDTQNIEYEVHLGETTSVSASLTLPVEIALDTIEVTENESLPDKSPQKTPVKPNNQPKPQVKASGPGYITVPGLPGQPFFYVFVDGKHVGETGGFSNQIVENGSHLLELSKNRAGTQLVMRKRIEIAPGDSISIKPELSALGTLSVNSKPWGFVYIDGRKYSEVPLVVDLPVGQYSIRVENSKGLAATRTINIKTRTTEELSLELK